MSYFVVSASSIPSVLPPPGLQSPFTPAKSTSGTGREELCVLVRVFTDKRFLLWKKSDMMRWHLEKSKT